MLARVSPVQVQDALSFGSSGYMFRVCQGFGRFGVASRMRVAPKPVQKRVLISRLWF